MNIKISLVMLVNNVDVLNLKLKNILSQSISDWELFLIVDSDNFPFIDYLYDSRFYLINVKNYTSFLDCILNLLPLLNGSLICFLNSFDMDHYKRLEIQSSFMYENKDLFISSSLEIPLVNNPISNMGSDNSNLFVTNTEIDFAVLGGYVPLDIYTFMIKKDFLILISKFTSNYILENELDFILFFLRYTQIEKVPEILYFFKNQRVPYAESINMDNSSTSSNKISIFNKYKSIEYRNYISNALIETSKLPLSNNVADFKYNTLVIIDDLNVGGTETYILTLSNALRKLGIFTYIVTSGGVFLDLFIQNNIPVIKLNLGLYKQGFSSCQSILASLCDIISKYSIKLVQIHTPNDIPLCSLLKNIIDIPIVVTIHGIYYPKEIFEKHSASISHFIFVSTEAKNFYINYFPSNNILYSLIPNAIESNVILPKNNYLHSLLNIPSKGKIILYCSRLSSGKAPLALIVLNSFEKIAAENEDVYIVILGDGDSKIQIDLLSENLNSCYSNKRIYILGSVYNVNDYFSDSAFIIGTGRVALEALNCSKAVIALGFSKYLGIVSPSNISNIIDTNFGDHISTTTNNPSLDYSESLTNDILYLLNNPIECKNLGLWGEDYCIKNLNLSKTSIKISTLFDDILSNYIN